MRGRVDFDNGDRAAMTHDERLRRDMLVKYINDFNLSWAVGKFSGADRWPYKIYDVANVDGSLVVTDRAFECQITAYGAPGIDWHTLRLEYQKGVNEEWYLFRPSVMLPAWAEACGDPLESE
jgi:hypothetical protein